VQVRAVTSALSRWLRKGELRISAKDRLLCRPLLLAMLPGLRCTERQPNGSEVQRLAPAGGTVRRVPLCMVVLLVWCVWLYHHRTSCRRSRCQPLRVPRPDHSRWICACSWRAPPGRRRATRRSFRAARASPLRRSSASFSASRVASCDGGPCHRW
jgi:hypothetical protein